MNKSIALGKSIPYTFARVSAMKAKLIDISEYHKLLKMDINTLTRYLQDSDYKESITKFSTEYSGFELMDNAIQAHLVRIFNKLRRISPENVVEVINLYLSRWDYQSTKVVMRGIFNESPKEEVMALIEPIGQFEKDHFEKLFELQSIEKVIKESKILDEKEMQKAYEHFKRNNNLIELENQIDKLYFQKAIAGASELGEYSEGYCDFLLRKIDILNIRNLLRFKREGISPQEIERYLLYEGKWLKTKHLKKLKMADSLKSLLDLLKHTHYGRFIKFTEGREIFDIELDSRKYLMKSAIRESRKNSTSIECVLGYMMRKVVEGINLRIIIKSKYFGVEEDYVEKHMLIV